MTTVKIMVIGGKLGLGDCLQKMLGRKTDIPVEVIQVSEGQAEGMVDAPGRVVMVDMGFLVDIHTRVIAQKDFTLLQPLLSAGASDDGVDVQTFHANRRAAQAAALARLRGGNRNGIPAHTPKVLRCNSRRGR